MHSFSNFLACTMVLTIFIDCLGLVQRMSVHSDQDVFDIDLDSLQVSDTQLSYMIGSYITCIRITWNNGMPVGA